MEKETWTLKEVGEKLGVSREAMLETRKRQLWQELVLRQQGIDFIERQIELIDEELGTRLC